MAKDLLNWFLFVQEQTFNKYISSSDIILQKHVRWHYISKVSWHWQNIGPKPSPIANKKTRVHKKTQQKSIKVKNHEAELYFTLKHKQE